VKRLGELGRRLAPGGSFRANVLTLMTGTAIAQIITVALSPVLTRLFSPETFGALGVYLSLVSIVGAVVTMRYDQAIMLPKANDEAVALFWGALMAAGLVGGISFLAVIIFSRHLLAMLQVPGLAGWIYLLPLSISLSGVYTTLNSWSTRQKKFGRASISQIVRSASAVIVQLCSGILKTGPGGLVGGVVSGDLLAALALGRQVKRDDGLILKQSLHWEKIRQTAKQYRDFPLFSAPQNLLNAISQNIPLLLLAKFFGPASAGFYVLAVRVIQLPMNLLLTSLRQVLFQKASELYNQGGDTYALFKKTTFSLLALVAIPALIVILFGPAIFTFALGGKWAIAGVYARWLVLWLMIGFANVAAVLFGQIYRKQKAFLILDVWLLFFRILAIMVGSWRKSAIVAIILFSLAGVLSNLYIIFWMGHVIRKESRS
jgi:lipopolysaccharide exporter